MAIFNAGKEGYLLARIDGRQVLFTSMRLDRATIPEGLYCYDTTWERFCAGNHSPWQKEALILRKTGGFAGGCPWRNSGRDKPGRHLRSGSRIGKKWTSREVRHYQQFYILGRR